MLVAEGDQELQRCSPNGDGMMGVVSSLQISLRNLYLEARHLREVRRAGEVKNVHVVVHLASVESADDEQAGCRRGRKHGTHAAMAACPRSAVARRSAKLCDGGRIEMHCGNGTMSGRHTEVE